MAAPRPSLNELDFDFLRNRVECAPDAGRLAELVKCPCCLNVAVPPIYSCCSGHNVCAACHRGKGHVICRECHKGHPPSYPKPCPVCNNKIFRNIVMEQILEKCKFPCMHSCEGCDFIGNGYEVGTHSLTCDHRFINCPKCKKDFRTKPFMLHMTQTFKEPLQLDDSGTFSAEFPIDPKTDYIQECSCTWLKYVNRDFFLRMEEGAGLNCIWMMISLLGVEAEVKEWRTRMKLISEEKGLELIYNCPVTSIRSSSIAARKQGHCVSVVPLVIKPFVKNNSITVHIQIMSRLPKTQQEEVTTKVLEAATSPPPQIQGADAEVEKFESDDIDAEEFESDDTDAEESESDDTDAEQSERDDPSDGFVR